MNDTNPIKVIKPGGDKEKKQKSMLKEREDLNQLRKERMIIELQSDIHNTEYTLNARRFRNPDSEGSK